MSMNLIGVPINYGCDKEGAQYGPRKLRQSGIMELMIKNEVESYDIGDIYVPEVKCEDKFKTNSNIKYYEAIYEVNKNLAHVVYNSLESENFPIIIGGDHSLALGTISGASKHFENLGIVWLDAHGDFNTDETSNSKNSHGMPLALVCGYGDEDLVNIYHENIKVEEENVFHIGGRDFDKREKELLDSSKVNLYCNEKIEKRGFKNILDEIIEKCEEQNIEALHLSLDIDFLDGALVPGTGTRVKDGYNVEDAKYILDRIFSTGLVKSLDFVEYNTVLDEENKTLDICLELLDYIIKAYKKSEAYNI